MADKHSSKQSLYPAHVPLIVIACCVVLAARQDNNGGQTAARQRARIAGKVVESSRGVPIAGARITLSDWALNTGKQPDYPSAETEADGAFTLTGVPPGEYRLSVEKDGYLDRSRKITLSAGDDVNGGFSLSRSASVSGRLVDEDGNGIPGGRVGAWSIGYSHGRPTRYAMGSTTTDQSGHYRLDGLRRGVYFVGAEPEVVEPQAGPPLDAETRPRPIYARSFYPDGKSIEQAVGIPVDNEQDLTDISILMRKTNGYCVTASLPAPASREAQAIVALQDAGAPSESSVGTGSIGSANRFHFCGVPSGDYVLFAIIASDPLTTSWVASERVTVDKRDVNAGTLALEQARELKGWIVVDKGQLINQRPPSAELQLEPLDRWRFGNEDVHTKSQSSGAFTFHSLYSGEYWVEVTNISPGYYVSQISAGPRDGLRGPIQVGQGDLIVTVRSDGASISGVVRADDGSELPASIAVVLAPNSTLNQASIQSTRTDQAGRFSLNNIPPGKFNLIAVHGLSPEEVENPLVINRIASQGKEVDLAPHSSQRVELHSLQAP